jgi:hypothetical protein
MVAIPVVPLPPKGSRTEAPGSVWQAMNIAIASGDILVGYEKALNKAPFLVEGNG